MPINAIIRITLKRRQTPESIESPVRCQLKVKTETDAANSFLIKNKKIKVC